MKLYRKASRGVPGYRFEDGCMSIEGSSIPFYKCDISDTISKYLTNYKKNPEHETVLSINLDCINCYSQRDLLKSLHILNDFSNKGNTVKVVWHYENEDDPVLDVGNLFSSMLNIPFQFKQKTIT
jgi:hypothetical protein